MSCSTQKHGITPVSSHRNLIATPSANPIVGRSYARGSGTIGTSRKVPSFVRREVAVVDTANRELVPADPPPLKIALGGAGIFFWWELGAIQWLSERYDLKKTLMVGASGGALAATLAATGVDAEKALESAHRLGEKYGIWERPLGLMGVWGQIIDEWLHELLPENAGDLCRDRVEVIVTRLPSFQLDAYSDFQSKEDLIDMNLTSVHVPFFMDGKPSRLCRGHWCMDGSFQDFLTGSNSHLLTCDGNTVLFDYFQDHALAYERMDFLSLKEYDEVKKLMELGYQHAQRLCDTGAFEKFDDSMCQQRWRWLPRPQWVFSS